MSRLDDLIREQILTQAKRHVKALYKKYCLNKDCIMNNPKYDFNCVFFMRGVEQLGFSNTTDCPKFKRN